MKPVTGSSQRTPTARICDRCEKSTSTRRDGHYGKFLHVRCFDRWWRSEYGELRGPYYRWMRGGMCAK